MNDYLLAVIFLLLAIGGVVVRKTYSYIPARELKRRAEQHDLLAARLYPAVAYGSSLRALLWLYIGLMTAAAIILLARVLPVWVSLLIVGPLLWAAFSWLPTSRVTAVGVRLTIIATPVITSLLNYLHPLLGRGSAVVHSRVHIQEHTGLFERDDLVEFIEQQQRQLDNRVREEELEIAKRALSFGDLHVRDVMTPRKKVKTALAGDTVGPVLIDELHKNGQGYMLVRESAKGDFVGLLAFKRLSLQSTGQVKNLMDKTVYYLHQDDSLNQAMHAFFVTNCPLFVVINSFEEYVGIISIDALLRRLLGHVPGEDFENYHEKATVAARHPRPGQKESSAVTVEPAEEKQPVAESGVKAPNDTTQAAKTKEKGRKSANTSVKTENKVVK